MNILLIGLFIETRRVSRSVSKVRVKGLTLTSVEDSQYSGRFKHNRHIVPGVGGGFNIAASGWQEDWEWGSVFTIQTTTDTVELVHFK